MKNNKWKYLMVFVMAVAMLCGITGCTSKETEKPKDIVAETSEYTAPSETATDIAKDTLKRTYPYFLIDSLGNEVTLEKKPETVAVLFSSYAEIWTLAGGTVDITVGESIDRGFASQEAILVDEKAGHSTIDLETLVAAAPDFVIGTADYECQVEAVNFCREQNIPAAAFRVEKAEDYLWMLSIFCDITDNGKAYQKYGEAVQERIETLLGRVNDYLASAEAKEPRILFVRAGSSDSSTKAKTSDDNFACVMLSELGAVNIADTDAALTGSLSIEAILVDNPEYLFITTMGDENAAKDHMNEVMASSGWKELACVTEGKYTYLPKELFHYKPNARWAEAYEYLIGILYPEVSLEQ